MQRPPVEVKICGITDALSFKAALDGGVKYVGFIFIPKSPRYITPQKAASLINEFMVTLRPAGVKLVAVMMDPTDKELADVLRVVKPDILQLHGSETKERVRDIAGVYDLSIMKAVPIASRKDIKHALSYVGYADMLLFDAKSPDGEHGGKGIPFDWTLLQGVTLNIPWFLSGGLHAKNISEAVHITHAKRIDISSGVEKSKGIKDPTKITAFLAAAKAIYTEPKL